MQHLLRFGKGFHRLARWHRGLSVLTGWHVTRTPAGVLPGHGGTYIGEAFSREYTAQGQLGRDVTSGMLTMQPTNLSQLPASSDSAARGYRPVTGS